MNVLILQPNILVTNMASCGWFVQQGYANASMQRGVELPYARGKLIEEQNKGCGGGRGLEGGLAGVSWEKNECPDFTAQHTRYN